MRITPKQIEDAINEILGISTKKPTERIKKKPGRRKLPPTHIWSLAFYNPYHNVTYALISTCIKEDFNQSMEQLALRLSIWKSRPVGECLRVLRRLKKSGRLGYYDENYIFRTWNGEECGYGLEGLCG